MTYHDDSSVPALGEVDEADAPVRRQRSRRLDRRLLALALAILLPAGVASAATHEPDPPGSTISAGGGAEGPPEMPDPDPQVVDSVPTEAVPPAPAEPAPPPTVTSVQSPAPAARPPAPTAPTAPVTKPVASLNGSGLYAVDATSGALTPLVRGVVHYPTWAPRGDRLLYVRDGQLHVVGHDGRNDRVMASTQFRGSWSPDGQRVAYAGDGGAWTIHLESGDRQQVAAGDVREVDWAPDGRRLAFVSQNTLEVVSLDGSGRRTLVTSAGWDGGITWSPDSTRIGYLDYERGPAVVDASSGAVTPLIGQQNMGWRMSWAPAGDALAFADYRNFSANDLSVAAADGSGVRRVIAGGVAPAWSPDGGRIAYQTYRNPDGRGRLETSLSIVNADGSGDRRLTANGRNGTATNPSWSPDGRTIAFTYNAG